MFRTTNDEEAQKSLSAESEMLAPEQSQGVPGPAYYHAYLLQKGFQTGGTVGPRTSQAPRRPLTSKSQPPGAQAVLVYRSYSTKPHSGNRTNPGPFTVLPRTTEAFYRLCSGQYDRPHH